MSIRFYTGKSNGNMAKSYFITPCLKLQPYKEGFELLIWFCAYYFSIRIMWNK